MVQLFGRLLGTDHCQIYKNLLQNISEWTNMSYLDNGFVGIIHEYFLHNDAGGRHPAGVGVAFVSGGRIFVTEANVPSDENRPRSHPTAVTLNYNRK